MCAPHYGQAGAEYTRRFRQDFIQALWSETDDSGSSLAEHLLGLDEGSPGNPIMGTANQQAKSNRMRVIRSKKAFKYLRSHIESPSFRTAVADPAIAGNGLAALALADQWFGVTGGNLKLEKQQHEWQSVTLAQFGIDTGTLRRTEQFLQTLNAERPAGHVYSDNALGARLLSCISFPDTLLADAIKELTAPSITHPPGTPGNDASGQPLAGQYNIVALVNRFELLWQAQCEAGKVKAAVAPKQAHPHSSNRVDGLSLSLASAADHAVAIAETTQGEIIFYECDEVDADGYEVYEIEFNSPGGDGDKICWNCLGSGHTQRDRAKPPGQDWACPSPRKRRDPKAHMAALAKLATARGGGAKPKFKVGRRPGPPGGPGPRNRFATRPAVQEAEAVQEADEPLEPVLSSVEVGPLARSTPDSDCTISSCKPVVADYVSEELEALDQFGDLDADFKKAFGINLSMAETTAKCATSPKLLSSKFTTLLVCMSASLMMAANGLRSFAALFSSATVNLARGPGRVLRTFGPGMILALTLFVLVKAAAGCPSISGKMALGNADGTISINELGFASTNSFPQSHRSEARKSIVPRANGANPDSGATVTASDRRSLFPTSAVTEYKPNLQVTVANGVNLQVELRGAMVIKGRANPYTSSAKKFVPVVVRDAILVPGLRKNTILLSPRTLFRNQGVRTYFNDELYMKLPNGTKVYLTETDTAYMIEIGDWDVSGMSLEAVNTIDRWMQGEASDGWTPSSSDGANATLVCEATPDRIHSRCMHASYQRLAASAEFVTGIDLTSIARPGACAGCDYVKPNYQAKASSHRKYERFGQCVCSDAIKMPKSTPFGYNAMVDFYDRATGHIAFYFLRTDTNLEMSTTFTLYQLDHREWLPNGTVQLWFFDNHGQFVTGKSEEALAALGTKVRSIVPWNPQMNPAERPWGSVLRPLRIVLAAHNVSEALWPFAASQWQFISNGLATRSSTTTQKGTSPFYMASGGRPPCETIVT